TPDDSFHDAEDFFDAPANADPWYDATETTVKDASHDGPGHASAVASSLVVSPSVQDQQQASVNESWADMMEDEVQGPVL
nr:hypothetical protein [Tanacetum cinerariifolium]